MYLVQILLPLRDNQGNPLPREIFDSIKQRLTDRYKGLTAYSRSPAEGLWKPRAKTERDEIVVYEVMVPEIDADWWRDYRKELEEQLRQESIIIRAQETHVL